MAATTPKAIDDCHELMLVDHPQLANSRVTAAFSTPMLQFFPDGFPHHVS